MKIHVKTPYSLEKNLGKAYNEAMKDISDDDWCVLIDYDVCFLTPNTIRHIHEYAKHNPDAGILTCYTNRIGQSSAVNQCLGKIISSNSDIKHHIKLAEQREKHLYQTTEIKRDISGFLMCISKKTWNRFKFPESGKCLGVDTDYGRMILGSGLKILRMDGIYVWHTYRLTTGIHDKKHLK